MNALNRLLLTDSRPFFKLTTWPQINAWQCGIIYKLTSSSFIYLFTSVTEIRVNGEQLLMFVMELLKKSCSQMWQTNWLKHGEPQFKGFAPWGKIIIQSQAHLTTTVLALTHFNQVFQNMFRRSWGVWREKKSMHWYWLSPPPETHITLLYLP